MDKQLKVHQSEIAGLAKHLRYLKAKSVREESFRSDLTYMKSYYHKQIASFEACNQANLAIIQEIGIFPDASYRDRRVTLKTAVHAVIAVHRMKEWSQRWKVQSAEKDKLDCAMAQRKAKARN